MFVCVCVFLVENRTLRNPDPQIEDRNKQIQSDIGDERVNEYYQLKQSKVWEEMKLQLMGLEDKNCGKS